MPQIRDWRDINNNSIINLTTIYQNLFHYHTYEEITDYGADGIDLHIVVCAESCYR